jgi:nucleoside triphosphate diphosphatase
MMAETSHGEGIAALLEVMRRLRDPVSGCSWDREQDYASIIPYTLEEAFEVADAVERADLAALRDELGDLLFQVVFLARIAEEQGAFDFDAVAAGIAAKLVRRHPHVFAGASHADAQAQTADWEHRKAVERAARGETGVLAGVARSLPALTRACKIGKRAGRVGFDWPGAAGVREKLAEELAEVDVAAQADPASADTFVVIICGETGSGKTTQIPKICLELGRGIDGLIGHTQPRASRPAAWRAGWRRSWAASWASAGRLQGALHRPGEQPKPRSSS